VRLGATARYLGMLTGPAVGCALLVAFGTAHGIFINALIYLPMILWLWKAPYGPRYRKDKPAPRPAVRSFSDLVATFRSIRENPTVLRMVLLAGSQRRSAAESSAYSAWPPAACECSVASP
jgi:hypothetical protein